MISHITSHIIDLTRLEKFYIITYSEVDVSLIICHLSHLTFLVNFCN